MKEIFSVDRLEGDIAVCISDSGEVIEVSLASLGGMTANDIFSAELCGNALRDIVPMPDERDRRIQKNRERLRALAMRSENSSENN